MESVQEAVASTSVSTHRGREGLAGCTQNTEAFESWEVQSEHISLRIVQV